MTSMPEQWFGSFRDGISEFRRERSGLGRYEIEGQLGEGGAAVVYRGRDRELGRTVALKVLRETLGSSGMVRERFQREAKVTAGLSHPNLVSVYDVGESDGRLYLVMELVEGRSLAHLLANRPDDPGEMVRLLEKVSQGVAVAHQQGIVHRDLKPANILITKEGEPKVGDFGLAHVAGSETGLTRTGTVLGTPLYMAPEQVKGQTSQISPRTDVYALGAILYEILTGRPPHTGESVTEIFGKIVGEEPMLPRRLNAKASRDLETIAMKALEKDPARRYATAREFGDDLRRFLDGEPILARPPGAAAKGVKWAKRHRLTSAVAGMLVLALGVFGALLKREAARAEALRLLETGRSALDKAFGSMYVRNVDFSELRKSVEEGRRLIEEAVRKAPGLPQGHYLLGRAWEIEGWPERAEESWRRAIRLDPAFGPARYRLGRLLLTRAFVASLGVAGGRWKEDEALKRLVLEAADEIQAAGRCSNSFEDDPQRNLASAMLAYAEEGMSSARRIAQAAVERFPGSVGVEELHWLAGTAATDDEERMKAYDRALDIRPNFPLALLCRGYEKSRRKDPAGAIEDYAKAIRIDPRFATAFNNRGTLRKSQGDLDGAIEDFAEAIKIGPLDAYAYRNRGLAWQQKGDPDRAISDFAKAIELDPAMAEAFVDRGGAHKDKGDFPRAIADYTRAIEMDRKLVRAYINRAEVLGKQGDVKGAIMDCDRAIQLDPRAEMAWYNRGTERARMSDFDGAVADCTEAINLDPKLVRAYVNRGLALEKKGDLAGAIADCDRAIALDPLQAAAWYNRGNVRMKMGDLEGAIADFTEVLRIDPGNARAHCNRGFARYKRLKKVGLDEAILADAIADFERALEIDPRHVQAYAGRAQARYLKGNLEGAATDLEKALEVAPADSNERDELTRYLEQIRNEVRRRKER